MGNYFLNTVSFLSHIKSLLNKVFFLDAVKLVNVNPKCHYIKYIYFRSNYNNDENLNIKRR